MDWYGCGEACQVMWGSGVSASIIALGIIFAILIGLALYVYHALAWQTIARKLKHRYPWLAWIPFANIALILQLGGFGWGWVFLLLIPVLGWIALFILGVIATWRIFKKRKYPGWFALAPIVPKIGGVLYAIAIGFAAWGKK